MTDVIDSVGASGQVTGTERVDLLDALGVAVLQIDADHGVLHANQAWQELTGLDRDASMADGWLAALNTSTVPTARRWVEQCSGGDAECTTDWVLVHLHDGLRHVQVRARPIPGGSPACMLTMVDLTEHRHREAELRWRATHDALTGMISRDFFLEHVAHALARRDRSDTDVAVLFVDLDRFKAINDLYGHAVGDRALVEASVRIVAAVRASDVVARFAGDEFVVLCEDLDQPSEATDVAARIMAAFDKAQIMVGDDVALSMSVSVGVALTDGVSDTAPSVLDRADRAMYLAKQAGGGHVALDVERDGHGHPSQERSQASAHAKAQASSDLAKLHDHVVQHVLRAGLFLQTPRGASVAESQQDLDDALAELDGAVHLIAAAGLQRRGIDPESGYERQQDDPFARLRAFVQSATDQVDAYERRSTLNGDAWIRVVEASHALRRAMLALTL